MLFVLTEALFTNRTTNKAGDRTTQKMEREKKPTEQGDGDGMRQPAKEQMEGDATEQKEEKSVPPLEERSVHDDADTKTTPEKCCGPEKGTETDKEGARAQPQDDFERIRRIYNHCVDHDSPFCGITYVDLKCLLRACRWCCDNKSEALLDYRRKCVLA